MPINDPLDLEPLNPDPIMSVGGSPLSPPGGGDRAKPADVEPVPLETPAATPRPAPSGDRPVPIGIPVEDDQPPPGSYAVTDLDICPSCGAPMRGTDTLVCTRCGFDLKTMKKVRTVTGVTEIDEADIPDPDSDNIITPPGRGDMYVPGGVSALCALILIVAYFAGARGLYSGLADDAITFSVRISEAVRFLVLVLMWTGCAIGGLFATAHLLGMKVGNLHLAAMRMLAITTVMRIITLVGFSIVWVELVFEILVQLLLFTGLSMLCFNIKPREAPMLTGATVSLFVGLLLGGALLRWAATGT